MSSSTYHSTCGRGEGPANPVGFGIEPALMPMSACRPRSLPSGCHPQFSRLRIRPRVRFLRETSRGPQRVDLLNTARTSCLCTTSPRQHAPAGEALFWTQPPAEQAILCASTLSFPSTLSSAHSITTQEGLVAYRPFVQRTTPSGSRAGRGLLYTARTRDHQALCRPTAL